MSLFDKVNLPYTIVGIILIVFLLCCLIYAIVKKVKEKKTGIQEQGGVRYSTETNIKDANGNNNATFNQGDTLIAINQTLIVGKDLKPGKYTLLTSDQSDKVNVRIGRYVKEYAHGQEIILSDNTKITPVSGDIILR